MIMWRGEFSFNLFSSFHASANKSLIAFSVSPTYLLKTSGPLTILGGFAHKTQLSYLAINVFPVPGGP